MSRPSPLPRQKKAAPGLKPTLDSRAFSHFHGPQTPADITNCSVGGGGAESPLVENHGTR